MSSFINRRGFFAASGSVLATAAALLAGCTPSGNQTAGNTTGGGAASPAAATSGGAAAAGGTTLTGAGATFPAPLYQRWFQEYGQKNNVQINYQPIGSGGGIKAITAKSVDFGASDAPMNDAELGAAPGILHIPTVAGAVVVAYNAPGVPNNVKLTGDVIADMFAGKITRWDDARIAKLNPGVKLPTTSIAPFHRSDGSGTTNIFTTYLSEVSPSWRADVGAGKSVRWSKGIGGKGNQGVAALIKQTEGGVGYLELNYAVANRIPFATVRNAKGQSITPSVESTTQAAEGASLPTDFRKVIVNTNDPQGYPITGFTFLLVYPNAKPQLKQFLTWALTDGQKEAAALYYAPLPPSVQKRALAQVNKLK
jgi:phosphate transport system substrate-binding protein